MKRKAFGFGLKMLVVLGVLTMFGQFMSLLEGTSSLFQAICVLLPVFFFTRYIVKLEGRFARVQRHRRAALCVIRAQKSTTSVA